MFVCSKTTQQVNKNKQQRPLFHIVVCPVSLAGFCPERGQQPKKKKLKVCFIPPSFFSLLCFFFVFCFVFYFFFCICFLLFFSSICFSSLPCPSNLKEAAQAKETMKKTKDKKTTSATRRGQTREITGGKTKKKGQQMPDPPPPKKKVLDDRIESAVLWSRVAVWGSVGSFFPSFSRVCAISDCGSLWGFPSQFW